MRRSKFALGLVAALPMTFMVCPGYSAGFPVAFAAGGKSSTDSSNNTNVMNDLFGNTNIVGGVSGSNGVGNGSGNSLGNSAVAGAPNSTGNGVGNSAGGADGSAAGNSLGGIFGNSTGLGGVPSGSTSTSSSANGSGTASQKPSKPKHSRTSVSTPANLAGQQVVEPGYTDTLAEWQKMGIKDAPPFRVVIDPSQFRTANGPVPLVSGEQAHGYSEPVFDWKDSIPYIEFSVTVPKAALYQIRIDDYSASGSLVPIERGVLINGKYEYFESRSIELQRQWRDRAESFPTDIMGNQMPPDQVEVPTWQSQYVMDNTYLADQPLLFYLKKGVNVIRLTHVSQPVLIGRITINSPNSLPTYQQYRARFSRDSNTPTVMDTIEAEHPSAKSDPSIRAMPSANPGVTPHRNGLITLNTLGDTSWENGGQSVTWTIHVRQDGDYHLAFKYMQSEQINLPVYRTLEIDGSVPFQQVLRIPFAYTTTWRNLTLSDEHGTPYAFHLTKGTHELTLIADPAPYAPVIRTVQSVMKSLDSLSLDIKMVTGNTQDPNRDWNLTDIFPGISDDLNGYANQLLSAYHALEKLSGTNPDQAQNLLISAERLQDLAAKPDTIPYRFQDLADGQSSINEALGTMLQSLPEQPLALDRLYVFGRVKLPSPNAGFFQTLEADLANFFASFTKNYSQVGKPGQGTLTVWVNRPREYVSLMQQLADEDFTRRTGIKVSMMVMPDEQKLILANASGQAPDVALSLNNTTPFNMGVRGALLDLRQFPDYQQVEKRFSPGALLPFKFNGHVWAVPETQDFWVLFYRKDILQALHMTVPQTWNQVIADLPTLQRYGMNFYDPIAGAGGYKYFYTTVPFLYQSGAQLYRANGLGTAIDSEQALNGFKLMTDLFTVYGLPLQVPNFYSHFRQGDLPIGISDFNTYVQLTAAAPELKGLWGIAPMPGIRNANGQIERYAPGTGEADVIFSQTKMKNQAWAFLKWWTSARTQTTFGNEMQTIYGPSYSWNSSNLLAFKQLPWPSADIRTILDQWQWLEDIPHLPGDYMVERAISDAWNNVVFNGGNPRMQMEDAAIEADREIREQLVELGYLAPSGQVLHKIRMPVFVRPGGKGRASNGIR
ncbi:MAG: extracellular solute-binding protein [Alicyclobacillus sp.]|nr:extracellular solute-binding protein [Alicyclobacillus sp.]